MVKVVSRYNKHKEACDLTMHNGAIGLDRPPHNVVAILEIDDYNFRRRIIVNFLPYADEGIGFESAAIEANGTRLRNIRNLTFTSHIASKCSPVCPQRSTVSSP